MKHVLLIVPMIIVVSACAPIRPRLPGGMPIPRPHLSFEVIDVNKDGKSLILEAQETGDSISIKHVNS